MQNNRLPFILLLLSTVCLGADAPPAAKKKKMSLQDLLKTTSKSSSQSPSVAGVRGLDETSGTTDIDTQARDYNAIEKLERVVIHDEELKRFKDEGNLQ